MVSGEKPAVNHVEGSLYVMSPFSCCFQDSGFVFIFQQFDQNVYRCGSLEFIYKFIELPGCVDECFLLN